jgi:predicted NAD-dependent protein-ADP-ribosyltransferase YbiA (DUF1768 family)
MVVSRIDISVYYADTKKVESNDKKIELELFKLTIHNTKIIVAIGKLKKDFQTNNIYHWPIYLIKKNRKAMQIGIYEMSASKYSDTIQKEKYLKRPLMYSFVDETLLQMNALDLVDDISRKHKNTSIDYTIPKERSDIFKLNNGVYVAPSLSEETQHTSMEIELQYELDKNHEWIQKYMKNTNYSIIDNEGKGDCFFAAIQQSFLSIGQETSVSKLRNKVSNEVDEETYKYFKENHDMFHDSLLKTTIQIKELNQKYIQLREKTNNTLDRNDKRTFILQAKEIKELHDQLVKEKKITNEYYQEYKHMQKIDTLDDLRKLVKTCEFWAETWSISTMERILNIKFIIFSEENYKNDDIENVLLCGHINDKLINDMGTFNPEYYIILVHTGNHYKLITYKKKSIFKFIEIPYKTKMMIVDKCMEKSAGAFNIISDFETLKNNMGIVKKESISDFSDSHLRGLFDEEIVFKFYSKSANKLPGKGAGEKLPLELSEKNIEMFQKLQHGFPDWRKKLSNFWVESFTLDNHKWSSVEHYYQGSKFKKNNPAFYLSFSLDSDTDLSKDPAMAKGAGGKSGKYKGKLMRPIEVSIDHEFFEKRHKEEMYNAQYAKFQLKNLKQLLLHTGLAKLVHHVRGSEPIPFDELMLIRSKLAKD